jgi:hypothetical protein
MKVAILILLASVFISAQSSKTLRRKYGTPTSMTHTEMYTARRDDTSMQLSVGVAATYTNESVKGFLGKIMQEAKPSWDDIGKLIRETAEADFLFGPEIPLYLHELRTHANELRIWSDQYKDTYHIKPEGYDHKKVVEGMHSELDWLVKQFESGMKDKFKKYLTIGR